MGRKSFTSSELKRNCKNFLTSGTPESNINQSVIKLRSNFYQSCPSAKAEREKSKNINAFDLSVYQFIRKLKNNNSEDIRSERLNKKPNPWDLPSSYGYHIDRYVYMEQKMKSHDNIRDKLDEELQDIKKDLKELNDRIESISTSSYKDQIDMYRKFHEDNMNNGMIYNNKMDSISKITPIKNKNTKEYDCAYLLNHSCDKVIKWESQVNEKLIKSKSNENEVLEKTVDFIVTLSNGKKICIDPKSDIYRDIDEYNGTAQILRNNFDHYIVGSIQDIKLELEKLGITFKPLNPLYNLKF
jgi:hypothetical protein